MKEDGMKGHTRDAYENHNVELLTRELEKSLYQHFIPGMIHNFANPLNGIMGRTKLLQRRVEQSFARQQDGDDTVLTGDALEKVVRDIELIASGGDQFFELFNVVVGKFQRLGDTMERMVNLSQLIAAEIAFFDFYLDYKHNVKKKLILNDDIPTITAVPAELSLCLSALVGHSMASMNDVDSRCLVVMADYDGRNVVARIEDTGAVMDDETADLLASVVRGDPLPLSLNGMPGVIYAVALLAHRNASVYMQREGGVNRYILTFPVE